MSVKMPVQETFTWREKIDNSQFINWTTSHKKKVTYMTMSQWSVRLAGTRTCISFLITSTLVMALGLGDKLLWASKGKNVHVS